MKLFDARPNAICTFGLHIRQILSVSNIRFDSIMETSQYVVLPSWYCKPSDIMFNLLHIKRNHLNILVYEQHSLEIKKKFVTLFRSML